MSKHTAEAGPHSAEDILSFRTTGDWRSRDMRELCEVAETMYGVFLSVAFLGRAVTGPDDPRRAMIDYYDIPLRAFLSEGWPAEQAAAFLRAKYYWPDLRSPRLDFDSGESQLQFLALLERTAYRWMEGSALRVRSISIHSPGLVSFAGLGEPLRQLRELIKDVWFRNRQERELGELQLEAARRALSQIPYAEQVRDPAMADRAVMLLSRGIGRLRGLEDAGKLRDIAESLEESDE